MVKAHFKHRSNMSRIKLEETKSLQPEETINAEVKCELSS
jgi:hypothetical protein